MFSILLALITILDLESRFHHRFQPTTIAVDNDSALDIAIIFSGAVLPTDQHFDVVSSIRAVLKQIRTPIQHSRVKGHRDLEVPLHKLTKLELLNYECNLLAKYARAHMEAHRHLTPTLKLPLERIAIYHHGNKIYKNFNSTFLEKCYLPRVQLYYHRKYNWTNDTFDSINWEAVNVAMKRCTPSTAKWVTKYSTGFIGTGKCLAHREYWLDSKCPLCHCDSEDNIM